MQVVFIQNPPAGRKLSFETLMEEPRVFFDLAKTEFHHRETSSLILHFRSFPATKVHHRSYSEGDFFK